MKGQKYFSKPWLDDDVFKQWLVAILNRTNAKCKSCNKESFS